MMCSSGSDQLIASSLRKARELKQSHSLSRTVPESSDIRDAPSSSSESTSINHIDSCETLEPTGSVYEFSRGSVDQTCVDGKHNAIFTCGGSIRTKMVMSALRHAQEALRAEDEKLPREKIVFRQSK